MSTETDRGTGRVVGRATKGEKSATGSVWWAELSMGVAYVVTAAVFALSHTSVGPFADLTVTYGTLPTVLVLGAALALGAKFVLSGVRRAPYAVADGDATDDTGVGASQDGDL